jgi:hypothetical protein
MAKGVITARARKHEQFLFLIVYEAFAPVDAYMECYPKATRASAFKGASLLLARDEIRKQHELMLAKRRALTCVTTDFVTGMLVKAYELAIQVAQPAAAAAAAMDIAKLHGLVIERAQLEAVIRKPSDTPDSPDTMSEQEWLQLFMRAEPSKGSALVDATNKTLVDISPVISTLLPNSD